MSTWKDVQHYKPFKKLKLKPQGNITAHLLECLQLKGRAKKKPQKTDSVGKDVEELELSYSVDGNVKSYNHLASLAVS